MPIPPPDHDTLLAAIRACVIGAGRRPVRFHEFLKFSGFRRSAIFKYYPTWTDAMRAAGFDFQPYNARLHEHHLLADWARIVRKLRRIPTHKEYNIHGKYSSSTLEHRFGRWNEVPAAFRTLAKKSAKIRTQWKPILPFLPSSDFALEQSQTRRGVAPQSESEPDPRLLTQSRPRPGVAPQSGTKPEPQHHTNLARRYKRLRRTRPSPHAPRLRARPASGPAITLPGMRNAPVNELGVLCLFALLAPQLGFEIEALQAAFPDCEARRKIAPEKWQSIRIEFEYESKHFQEHGHDPAACDAIVCWTHNWKDCPKDLEIIALSEEINHLTQNAAIDR